MKRIFALVAAMTMAGCSQVNDVKDELANQHPDFADKVVEILLWIVNAIVGVLPNWLHGLWDSIFG